MRHYWKVAQKCGIYGGRQGDPGFRRIVFTQINRLKRNGKISTLSLDHLAEATLVQPGPLEMVEKRETQVTPLEWAEARHEDEEKDRTEVAVLLRQFETV